jgi:hypothetical protein
MTDYLKLELNPNGDHIKINWQTDRHSSRSKAVSLPAKLLRDRSHRIREALGGLNEYVQRNPSLNEERDPGWREYSSVLQTLRDRGRHLYNALFVIGNPTSGAFAETLQRIGPGADLEVHCSDDEVTLPLGFVYEGEARPPEGPPSRAHFSGFWLDRFNISMRVDGSVCEQNTLTVDPESLTTLYALDETEIHNASNYLGEDETKLALLTNIPVKAHYEWDKVSAACAEMGKTNRIVFVLAHSDGQYLKLSGRERDSEDFTTMLDNGRDENHAALLVLNCCLSAIGGEQSSLLSAVARKGFCGLIGTEAEILNTHALRCGIHLMWGLCALGKTLGDAFADMQRADDLFPLNLFYTCYADRGFGLREPLRGLAAA